MTPSQEQWRPVVGYEGYYEVSNQGRVRSVDRRFIRSDGKRVTLPGRTMRPRARVKDGYLQVSLRRNGTQATHAVHSLVLTAFVAPRPTDMEGCHSNGDRHDNRLSNLRWATHTDNVRDTLRHGTHRGFQASA